MAFLHALATPEFWIGLGTIVWVNIILSGDNAVVIALAARALPPRQQKQAVVWGAGAAVVLRILLTIVAVTLLQYPYLRLVGAAALLWIAVQLLVPDEGSGDEVKTSSSMLGAMKTILIADLVMSTDNVIAVAAVAKDSILLLTLGLVISIPLVVFGATLLMRLMERYPLIITLGAAVLGWTAGEMAASDPALAAWVAESAPWLHSGAPIAGAVLVVAVGTWLAKRKPAVAQSKHA
ncbi:MAG TPA: TerC family protein [Burkholderiales bacterium]|nr:TerC family protein [Burkholderiales bacterium]